MVRAGDSPGNFTHLGTQTIPISAPTEYLSNTGDNLTNVIEDIQTKQPEIFRAIVQTLTRQIPRLIDIQTLPLQGRWPTFSFSTSPILRSPPSR